MKISSNIAISETGFIFNPGTGESFSVNPIGKQIIRLMNQGKDQGEIRKIILEQYDVDEDTFEKDYHDFVKTLEYNSLTEK